MSQTAPMEYGELFVWAQDDALQVYCWYLRDELASANDLDAAVVSETRDMLVNSLYSPTLQGLFLTPGSPRAAAVRSVLAATRRCIIEGGDLSRETLAEWTIDGQTSPPDLQPRRRYGATIVVDRVLEVADALEAMFEGRLPQRPPYKDWWVGTGTPGATIGRNSL